MKLIATPVPAEIASTPALHLAASDKRHRLSEDFASRRLLFSLAA
jgi:hypothetical protein